MISIEETANDFSHSEHHDEYGDTASYTNESDPDSIIACDAAMVESIIQPVFLKNSIERHKNGNAKHVYSHSECNNACSSDEIVEKPVHSETTHDTSHLDESTTSAKSLIDEIESKIKAAINHNHQVHSNSIELESVIRNSASAPIPTELDFNSSAMPIESLSVPAISFEGPIVSFDESTCASTEFDVHRENCELKQHLADMKQELNRVKEETAQKEEEYNANVVKLKRELHRSKKLIKKLQTKKLADMESNFMASLDFLEAKLTEDIHTGDDDMEKRLAAMKEERDTARELNLPLFNDLKKLYEIKAMLENSVEELVQSLKDQNEVNAALEQKVSELVESEKEMLEKLKVANDTASKLSNEFLLAQEEIRRLKSQMELTHSMEKESTNTIIQQLRDENLHLHKRNQELETQCLSQNEELTLLRNEEQDLGWKLEAISATTDLQLKEMEDRMSELETRLHQQNE
eukprot:scaffold9934_cov48-Cyclotella_meneghiniana.AAC.2